MAITQLNNKQIKDGTLVIADFSATGTPSATTYLRGDNVWATPAGGGGSFAVTETELDFGSLPCADKTFTVTDALISGTSKIMCSESGNPATGRTAGDSLWDSIDYSAVAGAGSFTVYARPSGFIVDKRKMFYTYQ